MGGNAVSAADYLMDPVLVNAERMDKPLGELAYETQSVGLLGQKDVLDTPFSSVRISEKSFNYFASPGTGMGDVLSLAPSVRSSSSSLYNDVSIRGFNLSGHGMYINGIPGLLDQQHLTYVFVDNVSIIAGPNLGIAGTPVTQSVGGTVDFHSKVAQSEPNADLTLTYRGGNSFSETLDLGSRFGKDERYGIRVMANQIDGETAINNERLTEKYFC
jgi:iron complex outermembrane receptor protein